MHNDKFTTTDGKMERFWLCLFLLAGAQGRSMYEDHGLRENPGDAGKFESVTKNNLILIPLINT